MKKMFWVLVTLLLCAPMGTKAEKHQTKNINYETRHEVAVSYGALPSSRYMNGLSEMVAITTMLGYYSYGDDNYAGPVSGEYFFHLNRFMGVGGIAVYSHNKQSILINNKKEGTAWDNYFTLLPAVKFDWLRRRGFGMYSKLGLGVAMRSERQECNGAKDQSSFDAFFNFQFTFFGIEAGSSRLRAYAEVGMGEQGTALVGIRYKF